MTPEEKALELFPAKSWTQYYRDIWIAGYNARQSEVDQLKERNRLFDEHLEKANTLFIAERNRLKASYEKCMRISALETKRANEMQSEVDQLKESIKELQRGFVLQIEKLKECPTTK